MNKKIIVLIAAMVGASVLVVTASASGWGVPHPVKKPLSIREGSAKIENQRGHYRTRYFIGGGIHRGK